MLEVMISRIHHENRSKVYDHYKVDIEKDLDVTVDKSLKLTEHIDNKVKLANRNLGLIFRTFTFLDKEIFLNLYKSLVRPHLEYAASVWSPVYK